MIYYKDNELVIRDLEASDAQDITAGEIAQGWRASVKKYERRLRDADAGLAHALAAVYKGEVCGYINVYIDPKTGAFANKGISEIVDFGVLQKYQRRGIGSRLMDAAEEIAAKYSDTVYLGVGLHSGYGSAQRMYIKRGYIPDGSGVWYKDKICDQYAPCVNDDDLILYLSKKRR